MKKQVFVLVTTLLAGFALKAQDKVNTFVSEKVRLNQHNQWTEPSSLEPNIIVLDIENNIVTVESTLSDVHAFLNNQTEFRVVKGKQWQNQYQVYISEAGYNFLFDTRLRVISITKANIGYRAESLRFEQFQLQ